ncbi:FAD-dependent monooxygenase [Marinomonas fungiae]|uniref:2-polyprenyl-6-methoxyphenol hydroxylase and related FAD-dependent oxidoreductases n=1 Tax=Marinomonas fungiae TaxID=1137284 RepID=A0A0K6IPZ4_9GAMM|nr:FAD-dependent monooxygenase [Marinomonas fungiae]CUB05392.1 2-polyprenyl-6-methoxyphenol hydroxylase and related FAD-dependent oxidoreductases [Marinomonas fungiae]
MALQNQASRVIVVGAGIGGLTVALGLAKNGFQVRIFEQASSLSEVGAGLQLSPNAVKVLRQFGIAGAVSNHIFSPKYACIRDYQSGRYYLKSPLGKSVEQRYGAPYWHIHRADLHKELVQACYTAGVEIELDHRVLGYRNEKKHVTVLLDKKTEHVDLVIGADGIHSKVRELMLGVQAPIFTGQVAWRGTVPAAAIKGAEIQPNATVWAGPNKHLVTYYLRGGELVNFIAVEERSKWQQESWRQEGDVNELRRKFIGWHPEVSAVLEACDTTFLWALNGRPSLSKWHDERVVLLGDACHPMLPFMAQGAAMAIEDAYVLTQALLKYPYAQAFEKYEDLRKPRATAIQKQSRDNTGLYHMHGGWQGRMKLQALGLASKYASGIIHAKLDSIYGYDVTTLPI